jgi:hypothetical protein
MAEEPDRSKRYANSPKAKHGKMQDKGEQKAEGEVKAAEAKEGEGKGPTDKSAAAPGGVGKVGEDKGPKTDPNPSPEGGLIASDAHKAEIASATKFHAEEASAMSERHAKHIKEITNRHLKMQDGMEAKAEGEADASAGSPKELGKDKSEGKKGSEP